jgi:rod shape-determining protein MreD
VRIPLWTAAAILLALLAQSALSHAAPGYARILDPFLLVLVYCGLSGGETHGMLAGAVAGWVQDVHFGGTVMGLSGLTKILVGFAVGMGAARFLLAGPGARLLVLLLATVADAVLFEQLAAIFDVHAYELSAGGLATRAAANSVIGVLLFEIVDRRRRREARS